jgi:hypothetical protein
MQANPAHPSPRTQPSYEDPNVDERPWLALGIAAGLLGAAVVAAFFGVLDLLDRRLFWTPFALGSSLILDRLPAAEAPIEPVLVVAYTALHAGGFATIGLIAAFLLMTGSRVPGPVATRGLLVAGIFFVAIQGIFLTFGALFAPALIEMLGVGPVALANALASASMAALLCARAERVVGVARS